nr:nucleotide-binding alpha-beta plait domain-containing protein [Tanacetum cinerariifolium]
MSNWKSKEDDVQKVSTSIFVTNFPDKFGAKDLWNACNAYGHVVDAYIPDRRSKIGKRFGFVRFIKVTDVERLTNNLCTIWVGCFKLHANVDRFLREPVSKQPPKGNSYGVRNSNIGGRKNEDENKSMGPSYASAVSGVQMNKDPMDNIPSMVLDETCLNKEDYSMCLLGKVKEFASLTNLKVVLAKEGFSNIDFKYMGGFWVMMVFQDESTKARFRANSAVGSWFAQLIQAHNDFVCEERVMWVDIEGVPFVLAKEGFSNIDFKYMGGFWVMMVFQDESTKARFRANSAVGSWFAQLIQAHNDFVCEERVMWVDIEGVPCGLHTQRLCICMKMKSILVESFKLMYEGKVCWIRANEVSGWVPDFEEEEDEESSVGTLEDEELDAHMDDHKNLDGESDIEEDVGENSVGNPDENSIENRSIVGDKEEGSVKKQKPVRTEVRFDSFESTYSGHFKKSTVSRTRGSIIQLMDDLVNVGQTMGYGMTWCIKHLEEIIESQGANNETKSANVDLWCIKKCWGNFDFDYVKLLIISVYAPQDLRDKMTLWDYLLSAICNWEGEVLMLGDFNEVRDCSERFGSVFNKKGEDIFNTFIANAGIMEVPLGGCSFTWCHRSGTKMSKLDRFFISDTILDTCPSISAISLERLRNLQVELKSIDYQIDNGVVSDSVINQRMEVISHGFIPKGGNSAFVTLIPKILNANMVKDFRPISLIGSVYKIIAKILANRLSIVLGDIVNEIQFAFVAKRYILDGPFILNEIVQWCSKKNKQAMVFKVDFEKAYNSVIWDFFDDTLLKFGFGEKWRLWIRSCLKSSRGSVLKNLESIRARFFNGPEVNSKKSSWVRWKKVKASKDTGGLGVSSLFDLNRALMFKWIWRFIVKKESLWARVISALHGEDGKIGKTLSPKYTLLWLSIVKEVEVLKSHGIDLLSYMKPILGNGVNTSFWNVPWRGEMEFKDLAPRIYMLESMKGISVADKLAHGSLVLSLRRHPRGSVEQQQMEMIQEIIEGCSLSNSIDRWSLSFNGLGEFTVASVRRVIDDNMLPTGNSKTRWIKEVPIKINIHDWKVKSDCLPTRVNMSRRDSSMVGGG